jgi:hypothetical protein
MAPTSASRSSVDLSGSAVRGVGGQNNTRPAPVQRGTPVQKRNAKKVSRPSYARHAAAVRYRALDRGVRGCIARYWRPS